MRLPTLTIAATGDPVTPPEKLAAIAAEIPGARSVVIDAARHIVNAEKPEAFTPALTSFLDERRRHAHAPGRARRRPRRPRGRRDDRLHGRLPGLITRYAWGEIWTRPGLDRRMRSAITITALVALGHENELAMHIRAALRNGLTPDEIKEILLQSAIYCGVPAANTAFGIANRVLEEP